MSFRTFIISFFLIFVSTANSAVQIQETESLCLDCTVTMRSQIDNYYVPQINKKTNLNVNTKNVFLILPDSKSFAYAEDILWKKFMTYAVGTEFGAGINEQLKNITSNTPGAKIDFRLFFNVMKNNGSAGPTQYDPLWVTEAREPHDLFGFYNVKANNAIVGLNNYQKRAFAPFSLIHELFHLIDGVNEERLRLYPQDREMNHVIAEFRALLAELEFYRQLKTKKMAMLEQQNLFISPYHERFLSGNTVNYEAILAEILNLEFPLHKKSGWEIDTTDPQTYFLICKKAYNNFSIKEQKIPVNDIYDVLNFLSDPLENQTKGSELGVDQLVSMKYKQSKEQDFEKNKKIQNKIKLRIAKDGGLNQWLVKNEILNLKKFRKIGWNAPAEGGGPKARDDGD